MVAGCEGQLYNTYKGRFDIRLHLSVLGTEHPGYERSRRRGGAKFKGRLKLVRKHLSGQVQKWFVLVLPWEREKDSLV